VTAIALPAFVVGHAIRTTNAAELSVNGLVPGLWNRVALDERLLGLPCRVDHRLYAVLFDYESDENGAYTQLVGIGIDDAAAVPAGLALVGTGLEERVVFQARGEMPAALIESWGEVWRRTADGSLERFFTVDIEVHEPGGSASLLAAGRSA
jgi:predicted transcriptional regulator YdeE